MNRKQHRTQQAQAKKRARKYSKENAALESVTSTRILNHINSHPLCKAINMTPNNKGIPRGTPDILACVQGIFVMLEVKRPGKKSTPAQIVQQKFWKQARGIVCEVHSFDEAKNVIQQLIDSFEMVGDAVKRVKRHQSDG